jgi:hypothetical protein
MAAPWEGQSAAPAAPWEASAPAANAAPWEQPAPNPNAMSFKDIAAHPAFENASISDLSKLEKAKTGDEIQVDLNRNEMKKPVTVTKTGDDQYEVDPKQLPDMGGAIGAAVRAHLKALPGAAGGLAAMGAAEPYLSQLDQEGSVGKGIHLAGTLTAGIAGAAATELGMNKVREAESIGPDKQVAVDQKDHPIASMVGGLTPELFKPTMAFEPLKRLAMGGIGAGVTAGQQIVNAPSGQPLAQTLLSKQALTQDLVAAGQNAIFTDTTKLGNSVMKAGANPLGFGVAAAKSIPGPIAPSQSRSEFMANIDASAKSGNTSGANAAANSIAGIQPIQPEPFTRPQSPRELADANLAQGREELAKQVEPMKPTTPADVGKKAPTAVQTQIEKDLGIDKAVGISPEERAQRQDEFNQAIEAANRAKLQLTGLEGKFGSDGSIGKIPGTLEKPEEPGGPDVPADSTVLAERLNGELDKDHSAARAEAQNQIWLSDALTTNRATSATLSDHADALGGLAAEANAPVAPKEPTISQLEGREVFFDGKRGVLAKGDDGAWILKPTDQTESSPLKREYEIPGAPKDGDGVASQFGIKANPKKVSDTAPSTGGFINPAVAFHLGAPVAGAFVGYQFGSTPEEKFKNAVKGALVGLGGSWATHGLVHLASENPAFLDKLLATAHDFSSKVEGNNVPMSLSSILDVKNAGAIRSINNDPNAVQIKSPATLDGGASPGNGPRVAGQDPLSQGSPQQGPPISFGSRIPPPKLIPTPEEVTSARRATPEYRQQVLGDIMKVVNRVKSPGVDVRVKDQAIQMLTAKLGISEDNLKSILKSEQPISVLEAVRDGLIDQHNEGKLLVKNRQQAVAAETGIHMADMAQSKSDPFNYSTLIKDPLDATRSAISKFSDYAQNKINAAMDSAARGEKYLNGMDIVRDILDGRQGYRGFLNRVFGGKIDLGYQAREELKNQWKSGVSDLVDKNNIDEASAKRIGVYAVLRQGIPDIRLKNSNVTPEAIAKVKAEGLTPSEMEVYNAMRKVFDGPGGTYDKVASILHQEYNMDVTKVENYFPLHRDWDTYSPPISNPIAQRMSGEQEGMNRLALGLGEDMTRVGRTSKADQDMAIERQSKATTPVELNALKVFDQHVDASAHLAAYQHDLKMLGTIARSAAFREKYGVGGQDLILNHLDTVARDGAPAGAQRWGALDKFTRNTSAVVLGFRLLSQLKHVSNVGIALGEVGMNNFKDGLLDRTTPEGQQWIKDNALEIAKRAGGEQSIQDVMKDASGVIGNAQKTAFWLERKADAVIAEASVLAAYRQEAAKMGIQPDLSGKPNPEALRMALVTARKVITSPLAKDVPQALSRGSLTGKNMSLTHALFQFQSTMLRQYGYAKHDILGLGLKNMDYDKFVSSSLGLLAAIAGETGLVQLNRKLFGRPDEKGPNASFLKQAALEATKRIPFAGNVLGAAYGIQHNEFESGIPALDTLATGVKAGGKLAMNQAGLLAKPMSHVEKRADFYQALAPVSALPIPGGGIPGVASLSTLYKNQPTWLQKLEYQIKDNRVFSDHQP